MNKQKKLYPTGAAFFMIKKLSVLLNYIEGFPRMITTMVVTSTNKMMAAPDNLLNHQSIRKLKWCLKRLMLYVTTSHHVDAPIIKPVEKTSGDAR